MRLGVVIGRFQIDELHAGHKNLIDHALGDNDRVLVLLGCPGLYGLKKNRLDYETREFMIKEYFYSVCVLPVYDMRTDEAWSMQVDSVIQSMFPLATEVTLYGGRDSFIPHYKGCYRTEVYQQPEIECSSTDRRKQIKSSLLSTKLERKGAIWAAEHSFPGVKMAVDIALLRSDLSEVLLGRKRGSTLWQFPGGFVDPTDDTLEDAAKRELAEETGMTASKLRYLGSSKVDDWRLRSEDEYGITTAFFVASTEYLHDVAGAHDDLEEVRWFSIFLENNPPATLSPTHEPLYKMLETFTTENDSV